MQRIPRKTRFGDEPGGSAFVDETPVVGGLGSGHEDHNRRSLACEQPARHLEAIDPRQLHIEDHDFWFEPCCGTQCVLMAGLGAGDTFLVHGGAGGIGTFAIQLATAVGARVLTTGGSPEKLALCSELGADVTINYRDQDFVEVVREVTDGHGADVILDNMGAAYLGRNVAALATEGRLVVIGMQGGTTAELDLGVLMRKRAAIVATTLRARPTSEKATICRAVTEHVWPLVADGTIRAVVDTTMPLAEAAEAHRRMESGGHSGKILLVT